MGDNIVLLSLGVLIGVLVGVLVSIIYNEKRRRSSSGARVRQGVATVGQHEQAMVRTKERTALLNAEIHRLTTELSRVRAELEGAKRRGALNTGVFREERNALSRDMETLKKKNQSLITALAEANKLIASISQGQDERTVQYGGGVSGRDTIPVKVLKSGE